MTVSNGSVSTIYENTTTICISSVIFNSNIINMGVCSGNLNCSTTSISSSVVYKCRTFNCGIITFDFNSTTICSIVTFKCTVNDLSITTVTLNINSTTISSSGVVNKGTIFNCYTWLSTVINKSKCSTETITVTIMVICNSLTVCNVTYKCTVSNSGIRCVEVKTSIRGCSVINYHTIFYSNSITIETSDTTVFGCSVICKITIFYKNIMSTCFCTYTTTYLCKVAFKVTICNIDVKVVVITPCRSNMDCTTKYTILQCSCMCTTIKEGTIINRNMRSYILYNVNTTTGSTSVGKGYALNMNIIRPYVKYISTVLSIKYDISTLFSTN